MALWWTAFGRGATVGRSVGRLRGQDGVCVRVCVYVCVCGVSERACSLRLGTGVASVLLRPGAWCHSRSQYCGVAYTTTTSEDPEGFLSTFKLAATPLIPDYNTLHVGGVRRTVGRFNLREGAYCKSPEESALHVVVVVDRAARLW